jgi:hypothetical protein
VHLTPGRGDREFAPPHHADPAPLTRGQRLGDTGYRVVVGESNGFEADCNRSLDYTFRTDATIRSGRVNVKVDRLRNG